MNKAVFLLIIIILTGCQQFDETKKYQNKRKNIIDVRERIKEIELDNILIGQIAWPYSIDNYLLISDFKSYDKLIHIFDKSTFSYIASFADIGQGPGEITRIGHIEFDKSNNQLYVTDHGKLKIFSYALDSVLTNSEYLPKEKIKLNETQFPDYYYYINDTLSIGVTIKPIGFSDFKPSVAKWNMTTGDISPMKYEHPDIDKKRICFAVSTEHAIYVECYVNQDLMTICNLDGELICNIYGSGWNKKRNKKDYYGNVVFCDDKIIALFSGEDAFYKDQKDDVKYNFPTKFLVYDLNGNYLKTLETGYRIVRFCYDEEHNRLIMNMDDELQFAYLDLDGIV